MPGVRTCTAHCRWDIWACTIHCRGGEEGRAAAIRSWAIRHTCGEEGGSGREGALVWPAIWCIRCSCCRCFAFVGVHTKSFLVCVSPCGLGVCAWREVCVSEKVREEVCVYGFWVSTCVYTWGIPAS